MSVQLLSISQEESVLTQELDKYRLLTGNRAEKLIQLSRQFREEVMAGITGLLSNPGPMDNSELQFQLKRKVIEAFVLRVCVFEDKSIKDYTEFDFTKNVINPLTGRRSS